MNYEHMYHIIKLKHTVKSPYINISACQNLSNYVLYSF